MYLGYDGFWKHGRNLKSRDLKNIEGNTQYITDRHVYYEMVKENIWDKFTQLVIAERLPLGWEGKGLGAIQTGILHYYVLSSIIRY